MTNVLIAILISGLAGVLAAQETGSSPTEITKTDITKISPIRSTSLAVFGITLGEPVDAAQQKVKAAGFRSEVAPTKDGGRFFGSMTVHRKRFLASRTKVGRSRN